MSRGMQQKVAIARALLTSPTLLLLDEPTTGLDPRSKLEVQSFIEERHGQHDATIVLTTHDMEEADRLCDRLAILADGRVVIEGTPAELARAAQHAGSRSQPCMTCSCATPVAPSTTTSRKTTKTNRRQAERGTARSARSREARSSGPKADCADKT